MSLLFSGVKKIHICIGLVALIITPTCEHRQLTVLLMHKHNCRIKNMRAKTNTITINGRAYDASTGLPVTSHTKTATKPIGHQPMVIRPTVEATPAKSPTVRAASKSVPAAHKISVVDRSDQTATKGRGHHITVRVAGRQPQRSHTLMRKTVKKPSVRRVTHGVSGLAAQPPKTVFRKGGVAVRQERALSYHKSELVHKFAPRPAVNKVTAHIPVTPAPAHKTTASYDISNVPPTPVVQSDKPLREVHRDLFENAMHTATSHTAKMHPVPKHHRKAARLALGAASLVLLVAFFAYQNAPNIALKRASSTIGFTASTPGYRPSGFRSGPVQYEPGKVTISFHSNSDSRAYTVTQATTYFDNQSLQKDFLKGQTYETVQNNGQASFLYGNANLTWVRNGIWYNIQGDSQLSRDQLFRVASSLF
jgi:hypothetical protein